MKQSKIARLKLSRETLHQLGTGSLRAAVGGIVVPVTANNCSLNCTNVLSICYSCTTPLDGCPPPYTSPAYTCA